MFHGDVTGGHLQICHSRLSGAQVVQGLYPGLLPAFARRKKTTQLTVLPVTISWYLVEVMREFRCADSSGYCFCRKEPLEKSLLKIDSFDEMRFNFHSAFENCRHCSFIKFP